MKFKFYKQLIKVLPVLFLILATWANTAKAQGVDAVFFLDNSSSIDNTEWTEMSNSTKALIDKVLGCNPNNRIAITHFAGTYTNPTVVTDPRIFLETNFTTDATLAKSFVRRGGLASQGGTHYATLGNNTWLHENIATLQNALGTATASSQIVSTQKKLTRNSNNKLVVFIFTDAPATANGILRAAGFGTGASFDNYNTLKTSLGATIVVIHATTGEGVTADTNARAAAAAVASVGGSYNGTVQANAGDPQGSGVKPRKAAMSDIFDITSINVETITDNICRSCAPVVAISSVTPPTQNICLNGVAQPLVATATGTGTLTYQWYSNTTNSITGGNLISGATSATYNPPTSTAGTRYYYVVVSDSYCEGKSTSAIVSVTVGSTPCFGCNNTMYLSQGNTLFTIGTFTNPFTYPTVGTASVSYNAIGLNPLDGKIYGMQVSTTNLLVINTDGSSTNLGAVTSLPAGTYFGGEIDNLGNYYVIANAASGTSTMYKINIGTKSATPVSLKYANNTAASLYLPDMAYNVSTGLLYGVNGFSSTSTVRQLVTINPISGVVTNIGILYTEGNYGAMYTSSTGEVFGVRNDGGFYQFNLATGERVLISGATPSSANDGAHCVNSPITFSADLAITKTDGTTSYTPGTSTTYTVTATNNGPFGVLNAKVEDLVPAGIPTANVTYSAVASVGSTTSVVGTQIGNINDLIGLPVGGKVTYTVIVNIPFGFTGNLVNTATITAPSNITDTNLSNNTATDIDTSSACFREGRLGTGLPTKHGISALGRAGLDQGDNWPMVRESAWTALESKTKGFVINRIPTTAQVNAIPNPIEGMMVYDEEADCLKIYSTTNGVDFSWYCFKTLGCGKTSS